MIKILRALSVTGLLVVLNQHIQFEWWEGAVMGFCSMMLLSGMMRD